MGYERFMRLILGKKGQNIVLQLLPEWYKLGTMLNSEIKFENALISYQSDKHDDIMAPFQYGNELKCHSIKKKIS